MTEEKRAHDLFFPESEDDEGLSADEIGIISIVRTAPHQEHAAQSYTPQELVSPGTIFRLFGGGSYKVMARDRNGRVLKGGLRNYHFRGPSYPMDGSGPPPEKPKEAASVVAQSQPQYVQAPAQDFAPLAAAMQAIAQSNQANTAVLVELIKGQQSFTERIVTTLAAPREGGGGGGADLETFVEGMKMGTTQMENVINARAEALAQAKESTGDNDIAGTINAVTQAMGAAAALKGAGGGPKKKELPKPNGGTPPA